MRNILFLYWKSFLIFFPLKQRLLMVSLPCVRFKVCVFKFGDTVVLTGLLCFLFFFKKQCCRA